MSTKRMARNTYVENAASALSALQANEVNEAVHKAHTVIGNRSKRQVPDQDQDQDQDQDRKRQLGPKKNIFDLLHDATLKFCLVTRNKASKSFRVRILDQLSDYRSRNPNIDLYAQIELALLRCGKLLYMDSSDSNRSRSPKTIQGTFDPALTACVAAATVWKLTGIETNYRQETELVGGLSGSRSWEKIKPLVDTLSDIIRNTKELDSDATPTNESDASEGKGKGKGKGKGGTDEDVRGQLTRSKLSIGSDTQRTTVMKNAVQIDLLSRRNARGGEDTQEMLARSRAFLRLYKLWVLYDRDRVTSWTDLEKSTTREIADRESNDPANGDEEVLMDTWDEITRVTSDSPVGSSRNAGSNPRYRHSVFGALSPLTTETLTAAIQNALTRDMLTPEQSRLLLTPLTTTSRLVHRLKYFYEPNGKGLRDDICKLQGSYSGVEQSVALPLVE
jgi:hypothetical protein